MAGVSAREQTVRQLLEAWNRGAAPEDSDLMRRIAPDVELDFSDRVLNPDTYSGHEGFRRLHREVAELWDSFRMEPEQILSAGNTVVALVHAFARGRGSGLEVDDRAAMVVTFRDDAVVGVKVLRDRVGALREAGLPPQGP